MRGDQNGDLIFMREGVDATMLHRGSADEAKPKDT